MGKIDAMFLQKKPPRAGSQLLSYSMHFQGSTFQAQWSIPKVLGAPKSKQRRIPDPISCTFHAGHAALIKIIIRKWSQNLEILKPTECHLDENFLLKRIKLPFY